MVLHLTGDGGKGLPLLDGSLSALKLGLTVEVFPARDGLTPRRRAEDDLKSLRGMKVFPIVGKPVIEDLDLADGTKAVRLKVELDKPRQRRLSLYEKVYCAMADNRQVVATSFVTCSPGGGTFVRKSGILAFAEAHAESLVLDAARLGPERCQAAYAALDPRVAAALDKAHEGNTWLNKKANGRAAATFREALAIYDVLPAAHNGLAWALLQDRKAADIPEALRHAETAVDQSAHRDPNALDTLALACSRSGDAPRAVAAIREAIQLDPANPDLKRSLETYQKGAMKK